LASFLPQIVNSFVTLLNNGAHNDPEIIQQVVGIL